MGVANSHKHYSLIFCYRYDITLFSFPFSDWAKKFIHGERGGYASGTQCDTGANNTRYRQFQRIATVFAGNMIIEIRRSNDYN